jgi:hypothetical protein
VFLKKQKIIVSFVVEEREREREIEGVQENEEVSKTGE